ncbi:MAG: hypothetical protein GX443_03220 [Deltaproteobacteria bacterium]|nr:hypothetical protein [Deltaproteobacteria bacterium]
MLLHPAIISLVTGSLLVSGMLLYASYYGLKIIRKWNLLSGSEVQLGLERRTYLISTLMINAMAFQLLSLFLFIYTADRMAPLFVGAMCAAGTLKVNIWGYPTLLLKIINWLLAGIWLILNYTDNRGYDYPLIRKKYAALLFMAPLMLVETAAQAAYFLQMQPAVITSCCGTLFTSDAEGVTAGIVGLPKTPVEIAFYGGMFLTLAVGVIYCIKGKLGYPYALLSLFASVISAVALISFISLYFYELPTHHCPFCILQKEYGFVGYPLYFALLGGAVTGVGGAMIMPFRGRKSLAEVIPRIQRGLAVISVSCFALFSMIVVAGIALSNLRLR